MSLAELNINNLRDADWIYDSFLMSNRVRGDVDDKEYMRWRKFSSADVKYVGTGIGENICINSPPGFTPLADPPRPGILNQELFSIVPGSDGNVGSITINGMGPAYSESIDDQKQVLHLRFGTVRYKGMVTFFTSFYDSETATLARYGRASIGTFFGKLVGSVIGGLLSLPLAPFLFAGRGLNFLLGRQSTKWADFKPGMPLYWNRLQVMFSMLGASMGIIPRALENTGHYGNNADEFDDLSKEDMDAYKGAAHRLMPRLFKADGRFDVYNVFNSGARRDIEHRKVIAGLAERAQSPKALRDAILDYAQSRKLTPKAPSVPYESYLKNYLETSLGSMDLLSKDSDGANDRFNEGLKTSEQGDGTETTNKDNVSSAVDKVSGNTIDSQTQGTTKVDNNNTGEVDANGNRLTTLDTASTTGISTTSESKEMMTTLKSTGGVGEAVAVGFEKVAGYFSDLGNNLSTEFSNGASFLSLNVNYTGAGTTTWSNNMKAPTIESTINGASAMARDARISLSDGNTGFSIIDEASKAVRSMFDGATDMLQMSGLMALAGNAFVDFQKQWDSSTTTFPTMSFSIDVVLPYGNDINSYINGYSVIMALIAGAAPQSTGPQSHTAPNFCEAYCQGIGAIRLGMIESLSIEAGTGNLGYNENWRPLSFKINFTIADCSSICHAPITNGFNPLRPARRVLDDDNPFQDYISIMSGANVRDMIDPMRKLSIRTAARLKDYKAFFSPGHVASVIGNNGGVQLINKLFGETKLAGL